VDTTWSGSVEGFASRGRFETKLRIDDCIFRDYIARHVYTRCVEVCYVSFIDLRVITRDSSGETCQFRDLALTIVADTVCARPYAYYKKPMYVLKWSFMHVISTHERARKRERDQSNTQNHT